MSESWNYRKRNCCAVFPTWHTVCIHLWIECSRWNAPDVFHWLWSTLWSHVQVCWLTVEYLVYQCVPNTSILGQSESLRSTILPRISILLKTGSGYFIQLLSCFCSPLHHSVPHTFWHDLPCRRTTWKSPMLPRLVVFPMLLRKLWIQTWFCNCQPCLCSCRIVFECPPSVRDQGTMSALPNQLLHWVFPHWTKILLLSSKFDVIRIYS